MNLDNGFFTPTPLSEQALSILRSSLLIEGNRASLTCGEISPQEVFVEIKTTCERLKAKYKSPSSFIFESDPTPLIAAVLEAGRLPSRNPLAYFPTLGNVSRRMVKEKDIEKLPEGAKFLEPSAGRGDLVKRLIELGVSSSRIDVCELSPFNLPYLEELGVNIVGRDFLEYKPEHKYHYVLMNPPFTVGTNTYSYITHIEHAYSLLHYGGVLCSITPELGSKNTERDLEFKAFVRERGESSDIERGAFKASGMSGPTSMIQVQKPVPAEEASWSQPFDGYSSFYAYEFSIWMENEPEAMDEFFASKSEDEVRSCLERWVEKGRKLGYRLIPGDFDSILEDYVQEHCS